MAKKQNVQIGKYNYCRITRTIGHRYVDGQKIPVKKQFYGTSKRAAEEKYRQFLLERETKIVINDTKTFDNVLEYYVQNILLINSKYSVGTRKLYEESYITHLRGTNITKNVLCELTTEQLQKYYNDLQISHSALATLHKFIVGFFKWASINNYCENITSGLVIPAKKVIKKQEGIITWTDEELEKILDLKNEYYMTGLVYFAAYTGMRISELLGLKWEDIDSKIIHVRRQYNRGTWGPPKGNKERDIPIHPKLRWLIENEQKRKGLVFHTASGLPIDYHNIVVSLERYYKRIGIEPKKFHAYRATFITNLCRNGVPIQTVSKLAGHSNINVTARYYADIKTDELTDAIKKI